MRFRKTRVMSMGRRQMVTGLVVNDAPAVSRQQRKQLEAVLYNCVRHGVASQDRLGLGPRFRDHLQGRVAYVRQVQPHHATKLLTLFEQIRWATAPL